ncbi:MAG TPA: glycosyltransferase [Acidimicrobiales bacterium]|nr:glycosyltransferase [Acidimicrobiales bacterium]
MPPPGEAAHEPSDLQVELDAERAAVGHWRRVARQRSEELAALRRRPSVRALLGVERRLEPVVSVVGSGRRRVRAVTERLALSAGALRRGAARRRPPATPDVPANASRSEGPLLPGRPAVIVVVGTGQPGWLDALPAGVDVVRSQAPSGAGAALAGAVATTDPGVVGFVDAAAEPQTPDWLERLVAAVDGSAVAAVPVLVHPDRPLRHATAHDGLVRAAGVGLRLDGDDTPVAELLGAGGVPRPGGAAVDVAAGSGAALVVDRAAYDAVGGLAPDEDLDAAAVELCVRLRDAGGRVALLPGAVVVDHRPVRTRRDLRFAADPAGRGWAAAIDRSGALLRRAAERPLAAPERLDGRPHAPLRFAITVAAPSAKVAARWGDWHLAQGLAESLRLLGHEVRLQTADRADDLAGRASDVHLVLRGLQPVRRTAGQRHVLWIISHPEAVDDAELDAADLVLVASPRFADRLRHRTSTPVEVMLQATDQRRFRPRPVDPAHRHDVTIVAKTRDVRRPVVSDALAAGLRPAIYGGGWRGLVAPGLVVADHIDNEALPVVYSSAGVVLNDHWRTMRAWGLVSNRLFDVLACGTPVISDPVDGIDELFDRAVLEYHSPDELRALVDEVLADPKAAHQRADRGRKVVLANHTFDHRARQLLACLGGV